ncbi:MAG TPA: hypothetical protein DCE42_01980 [Myxococcales bacterium]|nr:hypothetical protein [Myxococcales bacterium]
MRLVKIDGEELKEVARMQPFTLSNLPLRFGSFLEVDGLTLSSYKSFTVEGWWYPTLLGTDTVVIAGQISRSKATAGLFVTKEGKAAAIVSTTGAFSLSHAAIAQNPLTLDKWHHIAMTFDGKSLILYVDAKKVSTQQINGPPARTGLPFRIGARSEAPGDMTGIIDGVIDSWAVWPRALSESEVTARMKRGLQEKEPAPAAKDVELYLGFDDPYGTIKDTSSQKRTLRVYNHGHPRVNGVLRDSVGFRLHHDQLVDAQWPSAAKISIPKNTPSGIYGVQVLVGPDFQIKSPSSGEIIIVIIRPKEPTKGTKIAIVAPVNTWIAYNAWPGSYPPDRPIEGITSRPRKPGDTIRHGGNNSAYDVMGDGSSIAHFHGWKRPNRRTWFTNVDKHGYNIRSTMTVYLAQWLDQQGLPYDAYTDWDLHQGNIPNDGSYKVVINHGHSEYWSREMVQQTHTFAEKGGSYVTLGGNLLTWSVALQGDVMETRKWLATLWRGEPDRHMAINQTLGGPWSIIDLCEQTSWFAMFGTVNHGVKPCSPAPTCFGKWTVKDNSHWLWQQGKLKNGRDFGESPSAGVYTVGHEMDSFLPSYQPPGLKSGTTPKVLAEGHRFGQPHTMQLMKLENIQSKSCLHFSTPPKEVPSNLTGPATPQTRSGHILYYQHRGGGHALTVGASASPWALKSDPVLSALVKKTLDCFAYQKNCAPTEGPEVPAGCGCEQPSQQGSSGMLLLVLCFVFLYRKRISQLQ